jgi:serine/threonine protein kinase
MDAIANLDYRGKISSTYKKKYADVQPTDLFEDFKELSKVHPGWFHEYREAFDLLELMLTIDYKKRPMASELLDHPFFKNMLEIPKPR